MNRTSNKSLSDNEQSVYCRSPSGQTKTHNHALQKSASFAETNGYVYINLQMSAYINDLLIDLIGFCCFFAT